MMGRSHGTPLEVVMEVVMEVNQGTPLPPEVVMEVVMEVDQGTPLEVVMEVDQGTPLEVVMEVDQGTPPEVVMEVDQGTPPEVVMEVVPPRSGHGSGPGYPPQKWSSWKLTRVPPLWTDHTSAICHQLYINWQAGGFPLKKGFLLVTLNF